jgi:DNA polymerase-2
MTVAGPQPVSRLVDPIDYCHYLDRQLRPIAEPICEVLGMDTEGLFDPSHQLSLF